MVTGGLEVRGLGGDDVVDDAHHREQHRGRDGDLFAAAGVVVLHGVLAGDAGHAESQGELLQGLAGAHQLGQLVAAVGGLLALDGVAPAEVVHTGQGIGVAAHGHGVTDGFVHGVGHHPVGVVVAELGADTVGDDQTGIGFQQRADDAGVGRTIVLDAAQGLDGAAAAHFVVVLADDVFLGADVQAVQHAAQEGALFAVGHVHADVFHLGGFPHGFQFQLGHAVMHEFHGQGGHGTVVVAHVEEAAVGVVAQGGGFHVHAGGQFHELVQLGGRHGQGHAFLGLGEQDLPGAQAVVLEGGLGDVQHAAAGVFGHFAHGGGKTAGAVVGDGVVQAQVTGAHDEVVHLALGDGVADLHGRGRGTFVQFLGGEGGAVDAVLADAAAGHDDDVAHFGLLFPALAAVDVGGDHTHGAAVDQGLAQVAFIEDQGAVDGGDAGLVAAVFHAFAHAFQHAAGMQQARGQFLVIEGGGEAEHVGVADQFRAHAGAHGVTVDAHDTGEGAAVGVQGGGAVVGLHLDAGVVAVDEGDDAGVVLEHGLAVVVVAQALADGGRGVTDAGLVQVVDLFALAGLLVLVMDAGGEDLVLAVFGPGLGQHFHFHVGGVGGQTGGLAAGLFVRGGELVADAVQLAQGQGPGVVAAGFLQGLVVHAGQGHHVHGVVGFAGDLGGLGFEAGLGLPFFGALDAEALDQGVAEQVAGQGLHLFTAEHAVGRAGDAVLHRGVDAQAVTGDAQHHGGGVTGGAAFVVGDAGAVAHFHDPVGSGFHEGQRLQRGLLQDGVVPDAFVHQTVHLGGIQTVHGVDFDLTDGGNGDLQRLEQMQRRLAALGIGNVGMKPGFHTIEHTVLALAAGIPPVLRNKAIIFCGRERSRPFVAGCPVPVPRAGWPGPRGPCPDSLRQPCAWPGRSRPHGCRQRCARRRCR